MNVAVMVGISLVVLSFGYFVYARLIAGWLGVDPSRTTPAHTMSDGIDYVPSRAPVLFGHHFASIAGAGPIVGPVIAAAYGWLPAFLWVLIGVVFLGAMFDFAVIIASVRHQGKSIGEVIEDNIGALGKRLFLCFSWFALILVIAAFTNIVAKTFAADPAVASASIFFVFIAMLFGFLVYRRNVPLSIATIIGVGCVAAAVYIGHKSWAKVDLSRDAELDGAMATLARGEATDSEKAQAETVIKARAVGLQIPTQEKHSEKEKNIRDIAKAAKFQLAVNRWTIPILIYISIASIAPVWILLQPRDYLNSFLLYAMLAAALVGTLVARPSCAMPAVIAFTAKDGPLFPMLFVIVACGAISGFHSLVGSGTTAKQISSEADARPIGYGAMLVEGILAVLALGAVAVLSSAGYAEAIAGKGAIMAFAEGIAKSMVKIRIPEDTGISFITLAVSCFALTSLDTGARLGRYAFQEFFESKDDRQKSILARNRYIATVVTVVLSGILAAKGIDVIWPIFGASNQLLAALGLLAISVWLARRRRQNLFTVIPMIFMFLITLTALGMLIRDRVKTQEYVLAGVAAVLFLLAIVLAIASFKRLTIRARTEENANGGEADSPPTSS